MLSFLNDPYFWLMMSPWFFVGMVGLAVIFIIFEAWYTPRLSHLIRKAKRRKLSMFWVAHDDGFMDLVLGTPQPEGIIKSFDKKHPRPIFVPIPKADIIDPKKNVKPLTPQDYLVFKRYISRDIGVPIWMMHSAKPAAVNPATLMALEMNKTKQTFQIPQLQMPGNPKGTPFEFDVWIPIEPKVIKSTLLQYFSSQHILANEKLSENIALAEAGHDWKKLILPIAAILGTVTITCIIAMLLVSGKLGGAAALWHGLSTLKGMFW